MFLHRFPIASAPEFIGCLLHLGVANIVIVAGTEGRIDLLDLDLVGCIVPIIVANVRHIQALLQQELTT
jgi:hypothetical protein